MCRLTHNHARAARALRTTTPGPHGRCKFAPHGANSYEAHAAEAAEPHPAAGPPAHESNDTTDPAAGADPRTSSSARSRRRGNAPSRTRKRNWPRSRVGAWSNPARAFRPAHSGPRPAAHAHPPARARPGGALCLLAAVRRRPFCRVRSPRVEYKVTTNWGTEPGQVQKCRHERKGKTRRARVVSPHTYIHPSPGKYWQILVLASIGRYRNGL